MALLPSQLYHLEITIMVTKTQLANGRMTVELLRRPALDSNITVVTKNVLEVTPSGEASTPTESTHKPIPSTLKVRSGPSTLGTVKLSLSR
jgi:hypothetical protein